MVGKPDVLPRGFPWASRDEVLEPLARGPHGRQAPGVDEMLQAQRLDVAVWYIPGP